MKRLMALALATSTVLAGVTPAAAQEPPPRPRPDTARAAPPPPPDSAALDSVRQEPRGDSVRPRPPISPTGAFLRSLVLPGWGQSRLNRNVTAGIFISFETLAAAMVWKSQWQLEFARTRNLYVRSHTQEREDWIVLLVFNHLMAAAEAYVSAHLWDFPPRLKVQALPGGGAAVGVRLPLR